MSTRTPANAFAVATTRRNLTRIYRENVRNGLSRGRDGVAAESLESSIWELSGSISRRLRSGNYQYTQFRQQLKSKGAGKEPRVISIPTARDRITLRALAEVLIEVYPQAKGVIPQVRVSEVSEELSRKRFDSFIHIDVKNFYPSITHVQVRKALATRIRKPEFVDAVMKAISTPTVPDLARKRGPMSVGVPQGLAISNVLSELIASPVDKEMRRLAECSYVRFVDDILIFCDGSDAKRLAEVVLDHLTRRDLQAHSLDEAQGKSRKGLVADGFEYLGYKFSDSTVSVRASSVLGLESRLAREFTRYRRLPDSRKPAYVRILKHRVDLAITGCVWDRSAYGWISYFRQLNDLTLLKELDLTVQRLKNRFGVPESVRFKKFMRAYFAVTHPHGKDGTYVPRFDALTISAMREVLLDFMAPEEVHQLPEHAIPRIFRGLMTRLTSELEHDIGNLS